MSQPTPLHTIYFAGGCFWGTEHLFKQVQGVQHTQTGYANSKIANPTYEQVCSGDTEAAETVRVDYDPHAVSLETLVHLFFESIDPTSLNKQGGDTGTQYRTGIYCTTPLQLQTAQHMVKQLQNSLKKTVMVEVMNLKNFYPAETYHQDYLEKNPGGYCHISPALFKKARTLGGKASARFAPPSREELKQRLSPMAFAVTMENETEPPFQNDYWDEARPGIYVDITTGEPLFSSTDKFDSGCGWPAFAKPIDQASLTHHTDTTHSMVRTEVRSKNGNAHLGHVFNDGPTRLGGKRFCINSAALRFIPKEEMQAQGYGDYLKYVK